MKRAAIGALACAGQPGRAFPSCSYERQQTAHVSDTLSLLVAHRRVNDLAKKSRDGK